jgi:hypothetical protein
MKLFGFTRRKMLLIALCLTRSDMEIRTYLDFGLLIKGFFMWGMSVYVGRTPGNSSHGGAGRGCQDPGLAKLNYSVLFARGQAIFYVQSQDCSGVSVFG